MLPVPPDHGEEVGAECWVRLILAETSYDGLTRHTDGLLQIVWHLHPSNCLHLWQNTSKEKCEYSKQQFEPFSSAGVEMLVEDQRWGSCNSFPRYKWLNKFKLFDNKINHTLKLWQLTHMDKSCVLLVNLHQLLVSFVSHAGLWVCSHGNEVGYTLHRDHKEFYSHVNMKCIIKEVLREKISSGVDMMTTKMKALIFMMISDMRQMSYWSRMLLAGGGLNVQLTCTGWIRPWLSVRAITLRAKCRTLDWLWKNASNTCFRYSCIMELLIPDEMSPISFKSSCLDSFFPART